MDKPKCIFDVRKEYSENRLQELAKEIHKIKGLGDFQNMTVYCAGSFGRLEGSEYSDIDLFFLCDGEESDLTEPRTKQFRFFGRLIDVVEELKFQKLSKDCEYLKIAHSGEMYKHIGGQQDDHLNYFTVRMLLLLESQCLTGQESYNKIVANIVNSYYEDFHDHSDHFQPTFLLNDIGRFWKTLLLNYENKRIQDGTKRQGEDDEIRRTKNKIRNYKLKFSRMTTCFATIAALGSYEVPIPQATVISVTKQTPRERLASIPNRCPAATEQVEAVLNSYAGFLRNTQLSEDDLNKLFSDRDGRTELFGEANAYGNKMFDLLKAIDENSVRPGHLMRYLVI